MAVFTQISEDEARAFLIRFAEIPKLTFLEPITQGVENSNYCLHTEQQKYILTLFEQRVKKEDIPYFTSLLAYLYQQGMPVPKIIANQQGVLYDTLKEKPALVSSFLKGRQAQHASVQHVTQVARFLAQLHQCSKDFPKRRANSLTLAHWKALLEKSYSLAHTVRGDLKNLICHTLASIEPLWPHEHTDDRLLPKGICHNDLFMDNVFFDDTHTLSGVFDFYFAAHEYFIYDIAVTLHAWCFPDPSQIDETLVHHFLASYQQERPLTEKEWELLPTIMIGAALRFISTRLYDWLYPPKVDAYIPKNPEEYILHLEWCLQHQKDWKNYRHTTCKQAT